MTWVLGKLNESANKQLISRLDIDQTEVFIDSKEDQQAAAFMVPFGCFVGLDFVIGFLCETSPSL